MLQRLVRLPYFVFILAPIVILSPALIPGKALFWGTPLLQFVPWRAWAWEVLKEGSLPLWNPLVGMGAPLVANYQSGLFYPPNWIYFLLAAFGGTELLAWGQGWLVAAHLVWASLGMGLLARRLGLGVLAQTVSGLAFGLSGYLVARAGFLSINATAAWMPWVILGLTRRGEGSRNVLYLSLCIGMMFLAGHAQTAWYILLLGVAWGAFLAFETTAQASRLDRNRREGSSLIKSLFWKIAGWATRAWGLLAVAAGWGLLLAAVQLLPTAEYLAQSQRATAVDYERAMTYSFWPWRLLGLLAPGLFGSPASGDYWGYGNYWEDAIYVGLLPFLLALGAILRRRSRPQHAGWYPEPGPGRPAMIAFLSVIILVSFLLALGNNLPLFPWLYRNVPTFDMFQSPTRFTLWAVFALALLAGYGVDSWRPPAGRSLYWVRLGTFAGVAVTLGAGIAALASPFGLGEINPTAIRAVALAGLWGVGSGILALAMPDRVTQTPGSQEKGWWPWAVAGLVTADLVVAGWGLNPAIDTAIYRGDLPADERLRAVVGEGRIYLPAADEEQLKFQRFLRFDTFFPEEGWEELRATLLPDVNMLAGIVSANNFDPLVPGRYARWMEALETMDESARERMLDLMAVTVIQRVDPASPAGVRFETRPGFPRLRWVGCGLVASSPEEALGWVTGGSAPLDSQVILEGSPETLYPACSPGEEGRAVGLNVLSESPNRLFLVVETAEPGYLVLSDVWYPGWQARLDGKPAAIRRANYLFRAVSVPVGEHQVELVYRPLSFYLGALLSALAWTTVAIFASLLSRSNQPVYSRGQSVS